MEFSSPFRSEKRANTTARIGILVLGMHRSGTSALARVLNLLGAELPRDLMAPAENSNPTGFFESAKLRALNDRMLVEAASHWDDWRVFDPSVLGPERLAFYEAEILRLIEEEFGDAPLLVLKDPRICRFVPLYEELLAGQGIEPRFILPHRNPLAVIASLAKRDGMSEGFAGLLWLRYVLDAEKSTRGKRRAFLSYEALLGDWRDTIDRATEALALVWPRGFDEAATEIDAHLSRDLQHHRPTVADLETKSEIPAWIKESYAALQTLAGTGGKSKEAVATLTRVRRNFEAAVPVFGRATFPELAAREGKVSAKLRRANGELEELTAQREALDADRRRVTGELRQRDGRIEELTAQKAVLEVEQRQVASELRQRDGRIEQLVAQGKVLEAEQRRVAGEITQRDKRIEELIAQKEALEAERRRAADELGHWGGQIEVLTAQIVGLETDVSALQEVLAVTGSKLTASEATVLKLGDHIASDTGRSRGLLSPIRSVVKGLRQAPLYFQRVVVARPFAGLKATATDGRFTEWTMTDNDPQFDLAWPNPHPLPAGSYQLSLEMSPSEQLVRPRLYVNSGKGFREDQCIPLHFQVAGKAKLATRIVFPRSVLGLRLDPSDEPGQLSLGRIQIRKVSRPEWYGALVARQCGQYVKDPISGIRAVGRTLNTIRRNGVQRPTAAFHSAASPSSLPATGVNMADRSASRPLHRRTIRRIEGRARYNSESDTTSTPVLVVGHASAAPLFGAERSLLDVLAALERNGYRVHAVLPHDNPGYFDAVLDHVCSLSVFEYEWWHAGRPLEESTISHFMDLMRELKIEVVHVNTIMLREPLEAARRLGVTTVVHVREIITGDPDLVEYIGLDSREIVEQVKRRADYVIGNSEAVLRAFECGDEGFKVYNGVDVNRLDISNPVSASEIRVGLISSNIPKKGLSDFARLAHLAQQELPQLRFVLIGPVNQHVRNLKDLAGIDQLPASLEIAGQAPDPQAAIEQVNIVINLSSFAESFGRTVAEAMAARRPVIVYDHGALPELVRPGIDGYVIPYGQYEQALEPLRELCRDPSRIAEMGEQARSRCVELFSLDSTAASLESAYRSIVHPPEAPVGARDALRIGYFLWHFPVPSETFVLNELRALVEQGIDVKVFCRHSPHRDFMPDFPIEWQQVATPGELAEALELTRRTIVHAHFTYPTVTEFLWPACEQIGLDFTFIAHAQDIFRYENDRRNQIAEISRSRFCRKIFVLGTFHHAYLVERGVRPEKLMINPQVSDALQLADSPIAQAVGARFDRFRICAVQRLVEKKGLQHLIEAAPGLKQLGVSVDIYGYGPLESSLAERIEEIGADNVRLCGPVKDREQLLKVFSEHDLLVASSVRASDGDMDGVPTVLIEAMGTGLPVLSSRIASVPDLIHDGVSGLLCEPGDAGGIIAAIERFYGMPEARIRGMAENAANTVRTRYCPKRIMANLLRQWGNDTVDILIVSRNNLPELEEIIERLFRYTSLPFSLIICDNDSDSDVVTYLDTLARRHENVTVIHKGYNSYVGPGTNTAMASGNSRYAIYVCGKEGFVINYGWESAMVEYMDQHPEVGLAGTLGYSPSYLTGLQYIENHPAFSHFRNREYAAGNPDRVFRHVQGGVFIIRRSMYDEIGGFSEDVPHLHTDTEYSYYAESCGWRLGSVEQVLSLYNRTRPALSSRLDEKVLVVHPGTLDTADMLDRIAAGTLALCNICGYCGDGFAGEDGCEICPECRSEPGQRTIYRYLAESLLTYRRLSGLYVNPHPSLVPSWREQFNGRTMPLGEFDHEVSSTNGRSSHEKFDVIYVDGLPEDDPPRTRHLARVLKPDGVLLLHEAVESTRAGGTVQADALATGGLRIEKRLRYGSGVVRFDWRALLICRRSVR